MKKQDKDDYKLKHQDKLCKPVQGLTQVEFKKKYEIKSEDIIFLVTKTRLKSPEATDYE